MVPQNCLWQILSGLESFLDSSYPSSTVNWSKNLCDEFANIFFRNKMHGIYADMILLQKPFKAPLYPSHNTSTVFFYSLSYHPSRRNSSPLVQALNQDPLSCPRAILKCPIWAIVDRVTELSIHPTPFMGYFIMTYEYIRCFLHWRKQILTLVMSTYSI